MHFGFVDGLGIRSGGRVSENAKRCVRCERRGGRRRGSVSVRDSGVVVRAVLRLNKTRVQAGKYDDEDEHGTKNSRSTEDIFIPAFTLTAIIGYGLIILYDFLKTSKSV
uniref:Uncharacterized protein n=1 Tax=Timspurckia oligopyrenoides TaxID=708627 RepID=A0A7S1ERW7_9RHOD|mmetsp:Transcript_3182/g.5606  ORF Transcript_3182/g.5606 Transcript_3182/m.5606 type:complete len:109 (+) Transcript_3182:205-531(+)